MTRAGPMRPMDAAAANGQVALQRCEDCGAGQYPPREVCRVCLSDRLAWAVTPSVPGRLLALTTLHHSNDPGVALPLRVGLVSLGPAMTAVCFVADGAAAGGAVQVRAAADAAGRAILTAA